MPCSDTVAAIATPNGRGGIGIIRISGPLAKSIALAICGKTPTPRLAEYSSFYDSEWNVLDKGILLYFPEPRSFTGEDVVELQGHGGPVVLDMLLTRVLSLGSSLAAPGEFTKRAFLNGKLDLTQAEAVSDLIDSCSSQAVRGANLSLQGFFSSKVRELTQGLIVLRAHIESSLDFSDEEIDVLSESQIGQQLKLLSQQVEKLLSSTYQGTLLRDGMTVVIAGQPNVGKSSLLNLLAKSDTAIVTDVPGTTRDLLRERILLDGLPVHIVDTAGLRESDNPVEQIGIDRAWGAINNADAVILLLDDSKGFMEPEQKILGQLPEGLELITVHNKIDLSGRPPSLCIDSRGDVIHLSAKTGIGIDILREHLKGIMGFSNSEEGTFLARRRHLESLKATELCISSALLHLNGNTSWELFAEDLRMAQQNLGEITGEFSSDELLGQIFENFCIGK